MDTRLVSKKDILKSAEALPAEDRLSLVQSLIRSLSSDQINELKVDYWDDLDGAEQRVAGSAKDLPHHMTDDFDEPLDDFNDYMDQKAS